MPSLYSYQRKAVDALNSGKHLCILGTGCGKTAVMFRWLRDTGQKNVVIVTTPSKARSGDMEREAVLWNGEEWLNDLESFKVISWYKLNSFTQEIPMSKYRRYAFAFDEVAKAKGYSTGMGNAFRRICMRCDVWTGYTATPGDAWKDFVAYFTACKLIKNKTQFLRDYCNMQSFRGFPEIVSYRNQNELLSMWRKISTAPDTSEMLREMPKEMHRVVEFKAPKEYKEVRKTRVYNGEFIDTTMGLCHRLRQLCFTKEKQEWLRDFIEGLGTNCIFFCNYIEEEEVVCEIAEKVLPKGAKIWRIDGKHHDIPTAETIGKYDIVVAHYLSGGEALNLQFMHYWVSVSPNYSYSTSIQARGRVKRIGQTHFMRFYYLWAHNTIEDDIYACLKGKSSFSEKAWAEQLDKEDGLC